MANQSSQNQQSDAVNPGRERCSNEYTSYKSLRDIHVFITGGASGIGATLVKAFVLQGAKVSFIDIDREMGESLAASIGNDCKGDENMYPAQFQTVDVTCIDDLREAIVNATEQYGAIGVLVNNVANDARHNIEDVTYSYWRQCMAVNLDASFFAAQQVFPDMKQAGCGSIINISSINAILGQSNMPGYVTAKAGLLGMTRSLARGFGGDGIRVNAVLPGWVVTDKQLQMWLTPEEEALWMNQVAIPKRILPADVAKLILFLASDDSSMITGQNYIIDGGRT